MKAIILAAGRGRRLWPFTADCPKCLLSIGPYTILEQQLLHLERAGIAEVVLVCGFGTERIGHRLENYAGALRVKILYNPFYAISENLISLWVARSEMEGPFVLLNGDSVFHPEILHRLLRMDAASCLMIDHKNAYDDDDMKVQVRGSRIVRICKSLSPDSADAASIGIMKFSGSGVCALRTMLEEIVSEETAMNSYFLESIQHLINRDFPVVHCAVDGLPWADVDTPEDLRRVRQAPSLFQRDGALLQPLYRAAKGNV